MSKSGINVHHANGDADFDIIASALNIAKEHQTIVIGEDTDLLILLLHHFDSIIHKPVFLYSNISKISYDIKHSKLVLGSELSVLALVIHALCGCDTTSKLHAMRAKTILQKFEKSQEFKDSVKVLASSTSERHTILEAGESLLLKLLGGKEEKRLDELRVRKYFEKLSGPSRQAVKAENLGPTTDAAQQHILRIYFQVQSWKGNVDLDPLDWGWKMTKQGLMPIEMTKQIAPTDLLKIVNVVAKQIVLGGIVHADSMVLNALTCA